jgi:extracellular elastinolytic metalloproteinase
VAARRRSTSRGSGWLGAGATTLDGTNAHAFSDFNDDDVAQASEEVTRTGGAFSFPLTPATGSTCDAAHLCSWTGAARRGRPTARRRRSSPFYFANRFYDHLASAPIGFGTAVGSFEGADRLQLNTDDPVAIAFCQPIAATDALRTGLYAKMLTFTLSINQP